MRIRIAVRFTFLLASIFLFPTFSAIAQTTPPTGKSEFMALEQVRAGMHGVAYTVFEGTKPEPMQVEVLGVEKDINGPRQDLILVRLIGDKPEYTGVVAGMSGSPVYIGGKLVGAISYRIGEFSKEPIAGVTPIAEMMQIDELDKSQPADAAAPNAAAPSVASRTSGPGEAMAPGGSTDLIQPIATPLVFSGFDPEAVHLFAAKFAAAGVTPVMGAGSATDEKQPEPLTPGSAVSMVLVRGDMNIAATCTVTYVDTGHLLACGHPVLQSGAVDVPMTKAHVVATLASQFDSFKIINTTETVGSFVQDRHAGIMGRMGTEAQMIPVTLSVHGGPQPREYHYEVLNNRQLTPVAIMATVFSSLRSLNEYSAEATYRLQGKISIDGYPDVGLHDMFAPNDYGSPPALNAAVSVGDRFNRIFSNPASRPDIKSVRVEFDQVSDRRTARLETARTDVTEARPGDDIMIEAVLRPYRGERLVRRIPVKVPTSTPRGVLRVLVSDGDTVDRMHGMSATAAPRLDLASTIALLNKQHANNQLYVSMLEPGPQAMIEDKVMPSLPLSIMNVMDGMRGTQDMMVVGESSVSEASLPLDYVVSGAQVISLEIK